MTEPKIEHHKVTLGDNNAQPASPYRLGGALSVTADTDYLREIRRRADRDTRFPGRAGSWNSNAIGFLLAEVDRLTKPAATTDGVEYAVQLPDGSVHRFGDQEWVRDGRAVKELPGGTAVTRKVTTVHGPWQPVGDPAEPEAGDAPAMGIPGYGQIN